MTELSLRRFGQPETQAVQGSALALPFEPASFDQVIAIGSLHHTGDLRKALDEVHRVLKDGGRASVMVYNAHSLNRLVTTPTARTLARVWPSKRRLILSRTLFDRSSDGSAAPHTDFVSKETFRRLTTKFRRVEVTTQNANAAVGLRSSAHSAIDAAADTRPCRRP